MSYNYPSSDTTSSISMTSNPSPSASALISPSTMSLSVPRVLIAHVACGAVATLLLLPLGVLIPRYGRAMSKGRWWFPIHMGAQLLGVTFAIVAITTGYKMGAAEGTAHPGLAIALITGLGVQVFLGSFVHWYKRKPKAAELATGRGVFHFVHIGLGLAVVMLGWATALTGFIQQWVGGYGAGFGQLVTGWKVIFGVFIGLFGIAYVLGVVALPSRMRRKNINDTSLAEPSEKELFSGGNVAHVNSKE